MTNVQQYFNAQHAAFNKAVTMFTLDSDAMECLVEEDCAYGDYADEYLAQCNVVAPTTDDPTAYNTFFDAFYNAVKLTLK